MVQPVYNLTLQTQVTNVSGITAAEVASSGFATFGAIHTSGYVRNADLIGSGYVKSFNGLKNSVTIVGSGGTTIWTDGQTIQISASGGAGSGVSLEEILNDIRTSGYVQHADLLVSGFLKHQDLLTSGYVRTINGLSNTPVITGSGAVIIWTDGNTIQIASTAGGGDATYSSLHTSGYVRNVDFVSSGFQTLQQLVTSGYVRHTDMLVSGYARLTDLLGSGFKPESQTDHGALLGLLDNDHPQYIRNSDFITSGFTTQIQITASGYVQHSELLVSGYLKHQDLLTSGYVRSINGLSNTPSVVGSGSIQVWVDGQTIQIGTSAVGGAPETDQYPVDARAVSGHIIPNSSGQWGIGGHDLFMKHIYANSGVYQSGVYVSGLQTIQKINNIAGPHITLAAGTNITLTPLDHTITIDAAGGAGITGVNGQTGPAITLIPGSGIRNVESPSSNTLKINASGSITGFILTDQPYNNTPLVMLSGLNWPVEAGKSYIIEANILTTASTGTNGHGLGILEVGGVGGTVAGVVDISTSATAAQKGGFTAYNTAVTGGASATATVIPSYITALVSGITANGTIGIGFRSELNTAVATAKRGSWGTITQVHPD